MYTREVFRKIKYIIPATAASTSAGVASSTALIPNSTTYPMGVNASITIQCLASTMFLTPLATATTAIGFRMNAGDALDLKLSTGISTIADSTTATYQVIVWE